MIPFLGRCDICRHVGTLEFVRPGMFVCQRLPEPDWIGAPEGVTFYKAREGPTTCHDIARIRGQVRGAQTPWRLLESLGLLPF